MRRPLVEREACVALRDHMQAARSDWLSKGKSWHNVLMFN